MEGISCTQMGGVLEWTRYCWKGSVFSPRGRPSYLYWGLSVDDNGFIQIIETGSLEELFLIRA